MVSPVPLPVTAAAVAVVGLVLGLTVPAALSRPSFDLSVRDLAGRDWVIETGQTLDECLAMWDDFPPEVGLSCDRR